MRTFTIKFVDKCFSDYLTDHHTRDGEALIAVEPAFYDSAALLAEAITDEVENVDFVDLDRSDLYKVAMKCAEGIALDGLRPVGDDGREISDIDADAAEEQPMIWFLVTMTETTLSTLRPLKSAGKFMACADGGYPLVYLTRGGDTLCASCATEQEHDHSDPVASGDVYWEGAPIDCACCGTMIASAYGEPSLDIAAIHRTLEQDGIDPSRFWQWSMGGDRRAMPESELQDLIARYRNGDDAPAKRDAGDDQ